MTVKGIDYAFYPHPAATAIKAAGFSFACRYSSDSPVNDQNGKNLLPGELNALLDAGLSVVLVFEAWAADRMLSGHSAGVADAQHADAVVKALGMTGLPVYFACDFDATEAQQPAINAYLDGAASVIGVGRTGIYGGYYPLGRALSAGKAAYAWQTAAWSGGQWDGRADLRQHGEVTVGGIVVDLDEAMQPDYGQWPRPGTVPPPPPPPPPVPVSWEDSLLATIPVIKKGDSGQIVKNWQGLLMAHGYSLSPYGSDGHFGDLTDTRTRAYQSDHHLTVDGVVGKNTWTAALTG